MARELPEGACSKGSCYARGKKQEWIIEGLDAPRKRILQLITLVSSLQEADCKQGPFSQELLACLDSKGLGQRCVKTLRSCLANSTVCAVPHEQLINTVQ